MGIFHEFAGYLTGRSWLYFASVGVMIWVLLGFGFTLLFDRRFHSGLFASPTLEAWLTVLQYALMGGVYGFLYRK